MTAPTRFLAAIALLVLGACTPTQTATEVECAALVDRLVVLELRREGFRDPVLEARRVAELRPALAPRLEACRKLALPKGALECAARAQTPPALAECLQE